MFRRPSSPTTLTRQVLCSCAALTVNRLRSARRPSRPTRPFQMAITPWTCSQADMEEAIDATPTRVTFEIGTIQPMSLALAPPLSSTGTIRVDHEASDASASGVSAGRAMGSGSWVDRLHQAGRKPFGVGSATI